MSPDRAAAEIIPDRDLVITREYDAPARIVFRAWSAAEHLMRWFGPVSYPVTHAEVDFRVGGRFRMQMTGPDGVKGPFFGGTYLVIEPDRLIRFDNGFEEPGSERMLWTVTFDERAGRTRLTVHTRFSSAAAKAEYVQMGFEQGLGSGLDQLTGVVAGLLADDRT